jgi:hypothetical protein
MERRDRVDLGDPESVEIERLGFTTLRIGLVGRVDDRLGRASQHRHRLAVGVRHARLRVEHADDEIRLRDRERDLFADTLPHRVVPVEVETSGVDEHVRSAERPDVGVVPIAGDPRLVVDDRERLSGEPVE